MAAIDRALPDTATEPTEPVAVSGAVEPLPSLLVALVFVAAVLAAGRLVRRRLASETELGR